MTKDGQRRFIFALFVWWIGLILANSVCEVFASVEWVSEFVPAIESFKLAAAPNSSCAADGTWTYAWLVAPIFFSWISYLAYIEPTYERTATQRGWGISLVFLLLIAGGAAVFYGIYDPYPGTDKGRWATMYRESEIGVMAVTTAAWCGTYGVLLMSALLLTDSLGIKRNQ